MRASGVLLPIFSLPSEGGIGCFSQDAYDFIDWLAKARQKYWQILPLGPAGSWDSPYQPLSCFAGDPQYIDPGTLRRKGLLNADELRQCYSLYATEDPAHVHYPLIHRHRRQLLRTAFARYTPDADYDAFCNANTDWLPDYALFISLHYHFEEDCWIDWPEDIRMRKDAALEHYREQLDEDIRFHTWTQYEFFSEWHALKKYAHSHAVDIIGDIPIYVSYDSADCWSHPEMFKLNRKLRPTAESGCPPDSFSPDGQRWGNPLYDWNSMKKTGYRWWIDRLRQNFKLYDVIRIDHFRGLESYYSIPVQAESALDGRWIKGPGMPFFKALFDELGDDCRLIAEDLGLITPPVESLRRRSSLPGMKVLQFAFDGNPDNPYLPENIESSSVAYTGTHDNNTTFGWYTALPREEQRTITDYIRDHRGIPATGRSSRAPIFGAASVTRHMVELAFHSAADTCIIPIQDYLLLDEDARINTPGTVGNNWNWRMRKAALSEELAAYISRLTSISAR